MATLKQRISLFLILCLTFSSLTIPINAAPWWADTDGDGVDDIYDLDDDNDGILDTIENIIIGTSSTSEYTIEVWPNFYQNFDNGTFGFENWDQNQSPNIDPYNWFVTGWVYKNFYNIWYWDYSYIANAVTPRNSYQHHPAVDPVYGATGRFFASDPNNNTPTLSDTINGLVSWETYQYSFWATNSEPNWRPNEINIEVDGTVLFTTGPLPTNSNYLPWTRFEFTFIAPNNGQVTVNLESIKTWAWGNDFYVDNIEIRLLKRDTDGDGIPDQVDLDSDNDGISDLQESWFSPVGLDTNNDGTIDLSEATSFSGWLANNFGTGWTIPNDSFNTSGDNFPDYLDLDSDDDGIPDATEARPSSEYLSYSATESMLDSDSDGILDMYDSDGSTSVWSGAIFGSTKTEFKTSVRTPENTDSSDTPDYLDLNSDNDEFLDSDSRESGTISWVTYSDPDGNVDNPLSSGTLNNDDADISETDFRSLDTSDISGYAWNDSNMNGVQNGWESAYSWATIHLLNASWSIIATTNTDTSGNYSFTWVLVWNYGLEIVVPAGFTLSPTGGWTISTDSDFDRTTNKITNISLWEANITNLDVWLFQLQNISLGWKVWDDSNNDALYDIVWESWLEWVIVQIYRDSNDNNEFDSTDAFLATGVTDTSWNYLFTNITSWDYLIVLPALNFSSGATFEWYMSSDDTIATQDPDNDIQNQDNGENSWNAVASLAITLLQGTESAGSGPVWNANLTLDIWLYKALGNIKSSGWWGDSSQSSSENIEEVEEESSTENTQETENTPTEIIDNTQSIIDKESISEKLTRFETPVYIEKKIFMWLPEVEQTTSLVLPKELPRTWTTIEQRVYTIEQSLVETDLPDSDVFRFAGSENTDIGFWKQALPEADKNAKKYIVVPSNGLVIPINEFEEGSRDYNEMLSGREGDINPALETGALEYPGTSSNGYGEIWNKVVFAHSSYWKNAPGRYKTHFQKIIELDEWEQVWVYEKSADGSYTQYKYETERSYNTPANNVEVLLPWEWKLLTLFTCTPIWGIEGRWIIKARYIEDDNQKMLEENQQETIVEQTWYFSGLDPRYREAIDTFAEAFESNTTGDIRSEAYELYQKVDTLLMKYDGNAQVTLVLEYLQYKLIPHILD